MGELLLYGMRACVNLVDDVLAFQLGVDVFPFVLPDLLGGAIHGACSLDGPVLQVHHANGVVTADGAEVRVVEREDMGDLFAWGSYRNGGETFLGLVVKDHLALCGCDEELLVRLDHLEGG